MWIPLFLLLATKLPLQASDSSYYDFPSHTDDMTLTTLTPADGLSDKTVFSICQDHRGFMWLGTLNGLNRYDGYEVKNYFHQPEDSTSLGGNYVKAVLEDSHQRLWVATYGGGLSRYLPGQDQFQQYNTQNSSLKTDSLLSLYEDRQHRLWVGTQGQGLYRYAPQQDDFVAVNDPQHPFQEVRQVVEDSTGCLWLATNRGLYRYDVKNHHFTRYVRQSDQSNSLSGNNVFALLIDAHDDLWVGTERRGLNHFDRDTQQFTHYLTDVEPGITPGSAIREVYQDRHRTLYVATTQGVGVYHPQQDTFLPLIQDSSSYAPNNEAAFTLYESRDGELWMGTFHHGAIRLSDNQHFVFTPVSPTELKDDNVSSITRDSLGNLYVGTIRGGVSVLNQRTGTWSYLTQNDGLPSNHIISLQTDGSGNVWMGSWQQGLRIYSPAQRTFVRYPPLPADFYRDQTFLNFAYHDGVLWLATNRDVYRYREEDRSLTLVTDSLAPLDQAVEITTLYADHRHDLWVGTKTGIYQVIDSSQTWLGHPLPGTDTRITAIREDQAHRLLIGTAEGSLYRMSADRTVVRTVEATPSLPPAIVAGILEDERGHLWVSSSKGLTELTVSDSAHQLIASAVVYNRHNALRSDYFNRKAFYQTKDAFWWGTNAGLLHFNPTVDRNPYVPSLVLTDFRVAGQAVAVPPGEPSSVQLTHDQNDFTATFAALYYANPDYTKYQFYLEGYDSTWRESGSERSVTYYDVPPGQYRLRVLATHHDGPWRSHRAVGLTILAPPPNIRGIHLVLLGAFLGLLIALGYAYRRRHPTSAPSLPGSSGAVPVPSSPMTVSPTNKKRAEDEAFVKRAEAVMVVNLSNAAFSAEDFAHEMGMSRTRLYQKMQQATGLTVREFIKNYRLRKAAVILSDEDKTVAEVAELVGFNGYPYFSKCFKKKFGKSPSEFSTLTS